MDKPKLDIHILLDAYFELNKKNEYDFELDHTIIDIAKDWDYKPPKKGGE